MAEKIPCVVVEDVDSAGFARHTYGPLAFDYYEDQVGPVPDGYAVVQRCGNRRCVELLHLDCVPAREALEFWQHRATVDKGSFEQAGDQAAALEYLQDAINRARVDDPPPMDLMAGPSAARIKAVYRVVLYSVRENGASDLSAESLAARASIPIPLMQRAVRILVAHSWLTGSIGALVPARGVDIVYNKKWT